MFARQYPRLVSIFVLGLTLTGVVARADDATSTFVGVLALAAEKDVAERIGLPDDVRTKLQDLIEEREQAALELAIKIKDLSPEERTKELAPFVAESEKVGLAILTEEQRTALEKVRIARAGMQSLTEESIAKQLSLSAEQTGKIAALIKERDEQLAAGADDKRTITLAYYERQLAKVLTPEQKASWDALAGLKAGETAPIPGVPAKTTEAGAPMVAGPGPGVGPVAGPSSTPSTTTNKTAEGTPSPVRGKVSPDGKLRFNFRYAPWKDVLDWFASQADLSLEAETIPQGTFNYTDTHAYTPGEAIDILNSVLLTKGYTLVRRGRLLMVVNLEDAPPLDRLVSRVEPEELDARGEFELVGCLFQLDKFAPEDAEAEIKKLIGPQGSIVIMPKARQIYVTETAGKLRTIRRIIERVENPDAGRDDALTEIVLKYVDLEAAMQTIRPLMGIPDDRYATPDAAIKIVPDEVGGRLIVSAKPDKLAKIQEIVKLIDLPSLDEGEPTAPLVPPQIVVYKLGGLDPNVVLPVMQTLLADLPDVRLTIDAKVNSLVAMGRPGEHATIRAVLDEMQKDKNQFDVIILRRVDPQLAVLTINKMFGAGEGGDPNAPKVDADPTTRQLIVRGSAEQVAAIRSLLEKMGESDSDEIATGERGPVRFLPITGANAQNVLSQMEAIWPTVKTNRIRVVKPSSDHGGSRPREMRVPREEEDPLDLLREFDNLPPKAGPPSKPKASEEKPAPQTPAADAKTTQRQRSRVKASFVAYQAPATEEPTVGEAAPKKVEKPSKPGAEIVVTVGPNGIILASEDLEALDEFEKLLQSLLDRAPVGGANDFTIIYLKFAKAETAAALLQEILGAGGGDSGGDGGGSGLIGNIASMALGGGGGGGDLLGGLLGLGGGDSGAPAASIATSGKVTIIPDPRLNALVVQAGAADMEIVEQLLKVIDQEFSPEDVQTQPTPRMIPVEYVTADEVATVVREVYAARITASAGAGQQRQQPSPEEFIRALRGGGRGSRGGAGADRQRGEEQKMTIGVDKRSNSLIVSAPDPLFREVQSLVKQIDQAGTETDEVTQVVQIKSANPELVKNAISAHLGVKAQINTTAATTTQQATQGGVAATNQQGGRGQGGQGRRSQGGGQAQQGADFFQGLQQAIQGGGGRGGLQGGGRGGQGGGRGGR